tara:strand:- start:587 stop:988 length:402 start_codon:yes stop_codon:yes gene_type:complete
MDFKVSDLMQYKSDDLDSYLRDIQKDLTIRSNINKKLEQNVKTDEANKMAVNNFMDRYDDIIEQQYNSLVLLNKQVKRQIELHKELTDKSLEYKKVVESERCVKIRGRLKEINEIKTQLNRFLEQRGIQAPKI